MTRKEGSMSTVLRPMTIAKLGYGAAPPESFWGGHDFCNEEEHIAACALTDMGIIWEYEARRIVWKVEINGRWKGFRAAVPDFYLPDLGVFIDAKGKRRCGSSRGQRNVVRAAGYGFEPFYFHRSENLESRLRRAIDRAVRDGERLKGGSFYPPERIFAMYLQARLPMQSCMESWRKMVFVAEKAKNAQG